MRKEVAEEVIVIPLKEKESEVWHALSLPPAGAAKRECQWEQSYKRAAVSQFPPILHKEQGWLRVLQHLQFSWPSKRQVGRVSPFLGLIAPSAAARSRISRVPEPWSQCLDGFIVQKSQKMYKNQGILPWSKPEENQNIFEKILLKSESEMRPVHKDLIWPSGRNKSHKDS